MMKDSEEPGKSDVSEQRKPVMIFPMIQPGVTAGRMGREVPLNPPAITQSFVVDTLSTAVGMLPVVDSRLPRQDHVGSLKARFGIGRMNYRVDPGLYALGRPDESAPVLVSANYKLSFDYLREALPGRTAWILVLDTNGINVWCAAGKGAFGTEEVVRRLRSSGLEKLVKHRRLILPQLGASRSPPRSQETPVLPYPTGRGARDLPSFVEADKPGRPSAGQTLPFGTACSFP
jgi:acetyl-CoA decarbonylase/synthase complex subunit gamma